MRYLISGISHFASPITTTRLISPPHATMLRNSAPISKVSKVLLHSSASQQCKPVAFRWHLQCLSQTPHRLLSTQPFNPALQNEHSNVISKSPTKSTLVLSQNPIQNLANVTSSQRRIYSTISQQMEAERHIPFISEEQMRERMREAAIRVKEEEYYLMSSPNAQIDTSLLNTTQENPQALFQSIMTKLEQEMGRENMNFPQEMFFLLGAPGAGKGTMESVLTEQLNLSCGPIVVSDLLNTLEMQKMKDNGLLINDRVVVEILLRTLLDAKYQNGCIIDGFPRSFVQSNVVSLLYDYICDWRLEREIQMKQATSIAGKKTKKVRKTQYKKPLFRMICLYVDEHASIQRQLARGRKIAEANRRFLETGYGQFEELRKTDCSVEAARRRYKHFALNAWESLNFLREKFPYNYIDASGSVASVERKVVEEVFLKTVKPSVSLSQL